MSYQNVTTVFFDRVLNENENYMTPAQPISDGKTSINLGFTVDFSERTLKYTYFTLFDIFIGIGGLKAFIEPFLAISVPFVIIYTIYQISVILRMKNEETYQKELIRFLSYTKWLIGKRANKSNDI